jgi:MFS family permease
MWGFSPITLTAVFGVYAFALPAALLTAGSLSDHVGRRPVLVASLLVAAGSMLVFLTATGVATLLLARAVQGVATGVATGTLSAALIDLQPRHRPRLGATISSAGPTLGLAVGAVGSGALVQYAPAPTHLVFAILIALFVVLAVAALQLPETVTATPGALASLRPSVCVPAPARPAFLLALPTLVATWGVGGFYLSLGPSLAAVTLHLTNHVIGGALIASLTGAGAVGSVIAGRLLPVTAMQAGASVLATGTALTLLGLAAASPIGLFAGSVVAGLGFGAAFQGAFRSLAALAAPGERAGLFAAIYVVSYLAFSVPSVIAGAVVLRAGLAATAAGFGLAVIGLAGTALLSIARATRTGDPEAAARRRPDGLGSQQLGDRVGCPAA